MKTGGIGRLIGVLRKEAHISQSKLCKGLCSVQLLSKIELEERTPDILLLEVLLQRLGKSAEKLEIILSLEEYEHIEYRDQIEDALRFGKIEEAEEKLKSYIKRYEHEGIMHRMYGYRMHGAIAIEKDISGVAEEWLKKAVILSVPEQNWLKLKWELLSTFELENFVLLCQAWIKQGKKDEAMDQLESIHWYVQEHITDEEEFVKIQSKVASLLGMIYNKKGYFQKCIQICEPIFELERDEFLLQAMSLLMENLYCAYEQCKEVEKAKKIQRWKACLEAIYEMQGLSMDSVNGMYFNFYGRQYYLDCELIRGERIRQGLTQAELSEGIYECVESLSRVENGKESPNRIKFQQLMERLNIDKSRYNGHLITRDYRALESDAKIEQLLSRDYYDEAKKELDYLERFLDMSEKQNIQLIERRKSIFLEREKILSSEQVKERTEELLKLTYCYEGEELTRVPFRNEAYLYNEICIMLWRTGRKQESISQYLKILKCFRGSRVACKYHFRSISAIVNNATDKMERTDLLEEAEYWIKFQITSLLKCGKSTSIELLMSTFVCILQREKEKRELCLELCRHVLWCSELFKKREYFEVTKKYICTNFGVEELY